MTADCHIKSLEQHSSLSRAVLGHFRCCLLNTSSLYDQKHSDASAPSSDIFNAKPCYKTAFAGSQSKHFLERGLRRQSEERGSRFGGVELNSFALIYRWQALRRARGQESFPQCSARQMEAQAAVPSSSQQYFSSAIRKDSLSIFFPFTSI